MTSDQKFPVNFDDPSTEDEIYDTECPEMDLAISGTTKQLLGATPQRREGAVRSTFEGAPTGLNIYKQDCGVTVDRLVWVDGWREGGSGEAMTLAVLKLGIKPEKHARVTYASLSLIMKSGERNDEDPQLVAWGPFRNPEKWNGTQASRRVNVTPSFKLSGGAGGSQASVGVEAQKETTWDQNYSEYGESVENYSKRKVAHHPNGVKWTLYENELLKKGVQREIRVAALFSRPRPIEKYRVEINVGVCRSGFKFWSGVNTVRWKVVARPGEKGNCYQEGLDIVETIEPSDLGRMAEHNSTNLNPVWLNSWDRFEGMPPASENSRNNSGLTTASTPKPSGSAEQSMPKSQDLSQGTGLGLSKDSADDFHTGAAPVAAEDPTSIRPRTPAVPSVIGHNGSIAPPLSRPENIRITILEERLAAAEARIAEQESLVHGLHQTLMRVAQTLLPVTSNPSNSGAI